jgi:hypothetical protein
MQPTERALMNGDLEGFSNIRVNELERKALARRYLDATEAWLRRLIDVKLTLTYGSNYLADGAAGACPEISKKNEGGDQRSVQQQPKQISQID